MSAETRDWRQLQGFLPDWAIVNLIKEEIVRISPLPDNWEKEMGSMSMDFHLGKKLLTSKNSSRIDVRVGVKHEDYIVNELREGESFTFIPGELVIAEVQERLILPDDIAAFVEGKSSLARLGFAVHLTAGRFDPGWDGTPVMEFLNSGYRDIAIPFGWPVCAFTFFPLGTKVDRPYRSRGRYFDHDGIHSLVHKEPRNGEPL